MKVDLKSNHPFDAFRCLMAAVTILRESGRFWAEAAGDKNLAKMLTGQALVVLGAAERLHYLYTTQFQNPWPEESADMDQEELDAWQKLKEKS